MQYIPKRTLAVSALLLGAGISTAALAQQPLDIVVRPVATVIEAPFAIVGSALGRPPAGVYNPEPARRAAVGYTSYGWAVVHPTVLKQTGPRYENPPNADYRHPIVLRRGSTVPGYVDTAPAVNISTRGMVRDARYDFFVSPQDRVVFLHPDTREVVRIVR